MSIPRSEEEWGEQRVGRCFFGEFKKCEENERGRDDGDGKRKGGFGGREGGGAGKNSGLIVWG